MLLLPLGAPLGGGERQCARREALLHFIHDALHCRHSAGCDSS